MPRIRDIAKATSLSTGTVSRALKDQPGLTEETRERVRAAALEMGYDMGQLKRPRIRRIVFALHRQHNTLSSSPFYSPMCLTMDANQSSSLPSMPILPIQRGLSRSS